MSCETGGQLDAAYVLGALAPAERHEYERHLASCPSCATSVRELAGIPGLLGRLEAAEVEELGGEADPPPPSLLPTLLAEASRARRTRRLWLAASAVAAAAVLVLATLLLGGGDQATAPPTASGASFETMAQVDQDVLRADVSVEDVSWGTRLRLRCAYDGSPAGAARLPAYALLVRTADGRVEQVATWRAVAGKVATIDAATAARSSDISSLEVRTVDGRSLLQLDR